MSDRDPASYTAADLADPSIEPATLGNIAAVRQDLWPAILAHPNCYPELAAYIRQYSAQPQAHAQQTQAAGQQPQQASQNYPAQPNQYGQGQFNPYNQYQQQAPTRLPLSKAWPQIVMAVAALLAAISLFLPAVTIDIFGEKISAHFFSPEAGNKTTGILVIVVMAAAIASAITAILGHQTSAKKASGGSGVGAGAVGIIIAVINIFDIIDTGHGASVGFGLISLLVFSIIVLVFGLLTLLPKFSANQR